MTAPTMSHPGFENPRADDPRRDAHASDPEPEQRSGVHHRQIADLEVKLAEAQVALARQRRDFEEDAASFGQAIARISHSERALGHTKTKLLAAEDRAAKAEARVLALSAQLELAEALAREQQIGFEREARTERERAARQSSADAAAKLEHQDAELARLRALLEAAVERELEQAQAFEELRAESDAKTLEIEVANERAARALAREGALREMAESLSRDSAEGAAECARLEESGKASEERARNALAALADREAELSHARRELAEVSTERARIIGQLGALEMLGREIAEVAHQARAEAEARSEAMPGELERRRECITLKPEPASTEERSPRISSGPEILIDGVPWRP